MAILGLAAAAPKLSVETNGMVVRQDIDITHDLNARASPLSEGGTIWRDNHGVVRAIFVIQIYEQLIQSFENSGYDLAKIILSEITNYGRTHGFSSIVTRNTWDAEFNAAAKVIKKATYMTLAITSRGSVQGTENASAMLQSWLEQGGKYFDVKQVDNALAHITRSDYEPEEEDETQRLSVRASNFCSGGTGGWYNFVVEGIDPQAVGVKVTC
ncbi:hypothetical protein NQ176_g3411 [Zarea fungicola]|uniref:Uncharacterized protein n=1 Tax=Zarea fungicola TaxID=93591 RepID=A0ACC1NJY9_9HYPO|nr:hypothetical protein NQ176_g3411 [Lecanicillium fungicola]